MKKKIFVHEKCRLGEPFHDGDKALIHPVEVETRVYCNRNDLDFSDIRYWHVMERLKYSVLRAQKGYDECFYTGDFDVNKCREKANNTLAKEICHKLNAATGKADFEVFNLQPYKITQCRYWDKNHYYEPWNSECCHDITDIFLNDNGIDGHYENYLKQTKFYYSNELIREKEIEKRIFKLNAELYKLKNELDDIQEEIKNTNVRIISFCGFMLPLIQAKLSEVNNVIEMFPSPNASKCYFTNGLKVTYNPCKLIESQFYPLNVAIELGDKELIYELIECGACKFSVGYFYDEKSKKSFKCAHSLDLLFGLCDNRHYNILKKNLKEHSEWNDELEAQYPDK